MWMTTMNETSRLTLELRDIVDNGENSVDIWNFDYPSYYKDEEKKAFEQKVIDHYYFRQIGSETVGRFLHQFRTKIREIMPYYVEMYKSVEIMQNIEDPFGNVDIVETFEEESTGQSSGTQTGESSDTSSSSSSSQSTENKEHRFSNTPQGDIDNLDTYMTEASKDKDTVEGSGSSEATNEGSSSLTSSGTSSGTVRHTLTRKGNQGVNTYAHDMIEFRKSIINVDMMIIKELNSLFLGIY